MSGIDWCISQGANILSTLACPGCAHKVITIGSTQTGKFETTVDLISSFSSRGPTEDARIKPDVVAPGEWITSAQNTGGFVDFRGTSMSTPMVAGLAALLLQARPFLTPEEMKALIMNSVYDYGVFIKDNTYGAGRVNASRAFNEINFTKTVVILNSERVHNIYVPFGSEEIRATLYWPENYSIHNDVDLYLLDPAGNIRDFSISAFNTDEMVIAKNPMAGYWKILVFPYDVSGSQKYAIASNYLPSEQFYFKNASLSKIVSHQINLTNCTQIKINTDWNSTSEDLDIYLYDASGNLKAYSNDINNNHENLTADNPVICSSSGGGGCGCGGGSWLLKIVPFDLKGSNLTRYTLTSNFPILEQINDSSSIPDLAIKNLSTSTRYIAPSSSFKLLNTVKNIGSSIANSFNVSFHLSKDQVYGGSDDIPFSAFRSIKSLGAGAINSSNKELAISSKTPLGKYYVCAFADSNNSVNELDETKNTLCTNFTINVTMPDLVIKSLSGPKNATRGTNITIKNTIYNKGRVSAKSFYVGFYLSNNSKITTSDILLGNRSVVSLSALKTNTTNTTLKIPTNITNGTYYLGVIADFKNKVKELNESNNAKSGNKIAIN